MQIKCEKNAKPLGFAPFCDAFIVELTLLTNKSFAKKVRISCPKSISRTEMELRFVITEVHHLLRGIRSVDATEVSDSAIGP